VRATLAAALAAPGTAFRCQGRLARATAATPRIRFALRAADGMVLVGCEPVVRSRQSAREAAYLRALAHGALEATSDGLLVVDAKGRVRAANQRVLDMWRISGPVVPGTQDRALREAVRAQLADAGAYVARVHAIMSATERGSYDVVEFLDGRVYERYSQPLWVEGRAEGRVWSFLDITESRRAEQVLQASEDRFHHAARGAHDGLWEWEVDGDTLSLSPRWAAALGMPDAPLRCTLADWAALIHPNDRDRFLSALDTHLRGDQPVFECEYRARHADGGERWMLCRGLAVRGEDGRAVRVAGSQADVTGRRSAEEALAIRDLYDELTELPNRGLFKDRLRQAVRRGRPFAVALLDLDRFKTINESLGHTVGDEVLREVARRLEACLTPGDTVARFGADVFTLLLDGVADASEATRMAGQVLRAMGAPIRAGGREVFTSASIGLVLPNPEHSADELLRDADTAMHRAKAAGRGRCQLFDPRMHAQAVARLQMETQLRRAVDRQELSVVYQPLIRLDSGVVEGFEALVRWTQEDGTTRSPAEFIPLAEETGLIVPLGIQVLRAACMQMAAWRASVGTRALHVNVNLSARQLAHPGLAGDVAAILAETGLDGGVLRLEITESVLAENAEATTATMAALRALGVCLCIDDFGTGYSSLAYLHRLPVDCLKVDRSFVHRIGTDQESAEIVRTILSLARNLGLRTVAEGVETDDQLRFVREAGCDYAQGFGIHRPLDVAAATALLGDTAGNRE
jgi:diguanylate cyclase (GGDEF)-like protein/PAS domain S-box-containing protein